MCSLLRALIFSYLALTCLLDSIQAETPIRKCVSNKPLPLMVQVANCSELPCDLFKNEVTHMAIQFVTTRDTVFKMRAAMKITTLGFEIPFELAEERSDICRNLMFGAYCPLYNGEDVTYHLMLTLSDNQPEVPIKVEVKLMDTSDDEVLACFVVDGRIKKQLSH